MGRSAEDPKEVAARNGRTNASQKKSVSIPASFPKMPSTLTKGAQLYWNFYCELYTTTNILTCFDGAALAGLCDCLYMRDYFIARRQSFIDDGQELVYQTSNESWTVRPCVSWIEKYDSKILLHCRVLGLDPLNRSSIKPAEKKDKKSTRSSMKKR